MPRSSGAQPSESSSMLKDATCVIFVVSNTFRVIENSCSSTNHSSKEMRGILEKMPIKYKARFALHTLVYSVANNSSIIS
jgi:hypothetical protein